MKLLTMLLFACILSCNCAIKNRDKKVQEDIGLNIIDTIEYKVGDTIIPFKSYDFDSGDWEVKIFLSKDDDLRLPNKTSRKILSTNDKKILKKINNWKFIYKGSDVATISSTLKFFLRKKEVDAFEIIIDNNSVGLQSSKYGWILSVDNSVVETIMLLN